MVQNEIIATYIIDGAMLALSELDKKLSKIQQNSLDVINWEAYTYNPGVTFALAFCETALLLRYSIKQESVLARYQNDNESVWTDSCVEFFIKQPNTNSYYNIEVNAIGTVLIGKKEIGKVIEHQDITITKTIERYPSLGSIPIANKKN